MAKELFLVLKSQITTEKSANNMMNNTYVFNVDVSSSKKDVKAAVESVFEVKVKKITVLNVIGKSRRLGKSVVKKAKWKKAYVKLKDGHTLNQTQAY